MFKYQGLVAALVLVTLVLFALIFHSFGQALPPKGTFVGKPSPYDGRIIQLDREAIDEAYKDTMQHLFSVWTRSDEDQPGRAIRGATQARRAYILVMEAIDKREKLLKDEPSK